MKSVLLLSFLLSISWFVQDFLSDEYEEARQTYEYWVYNGCLLFHITMLNMLNIIFLFIAHHDAKRRNTLMTMLSNSLELFFHTKDSVSVRFPQINILDT